MQTRRFINRKLSSQYHYQHLIISKKYIITNFIFSMYIVQLADIEVLAIQQFILKEKKRAYDTFFLIYSKISVLILII